MKMAGDRTEQILIKKFELQATERYKVNKGTLDSNPSL